MTELCSPGGADLTTLSVRDLIIELARVEHLIRRRVIEDGFFDGGPRGRGFPGPPGGSSRPGGSRRDNQDGVTD